MPGRSGRRLSTVSFQHLLILPAAFCVLLIATASADPIISTGSDDKRLASFDRLMQDFMAQYHIPGASLAVGRNGKLIYARGFGFADQETRQPVQPDSLFRIASLSKMFTATAVLQLAEQHKLKRSDPVLSILKHKPFNGQMIDDRWKSVTIDQLLHHTGGWDRDASYDPMFRPVLIAKTLGEHPPADQDMIIRYMLGQKLDFDPGTRYAYSNFGYCLLGRVIEQVSGEKYELYVKHHLLAPLGIKDMRLGRTREKDRAETEVTYFAPGSAKSVFTEDLGQPVPWPYGGWNLEAMDSHGGWIASAADLVRFGQSFDEGASTPLLDRESIRTCFARPAGAPGWKGEKPLPTYYGCGWQVRPVGTSGKMNTWHTGLLDGTSTLLVRRYDGLTWAVLFNTARRGDKDTPVSNLIDPLLHKAADEVKDWPEKDLFPTIGPR